MQPLLKLSKLNVKSRENGLLLLKNISFEVGPDEIHCILGKNGSGKSTIAYAIMGMERLRLDSGKIFFKGIEIQKKKVNQRANLGLTLAFQEPARFEGLTVRDFLRAGNKKAAEKELGKVLRLVGLSENYCPVRSR